MTAVKVFFIPLTPILLLNRGPNFIFSPESSIHGLFWHNSSIDNCQQQGAEMCSEEIYWKPITNIFRAQAESMMKIFSVDVWHQIYLCVKPLTTAKEAEARLSFNVQSTAKGVDATSMVSEIQYPFLLLHERMRIPNLTGNRIITYPTTSICIFKLKRTIHC